MQKDAGLIAWVGVVLPQVHSAYCGWRWSQGSLALGELSSQGLQTWYMLTTNAARPERLDCSFLRIGQFSRRVWWMGVVRPFDDVWGVRFMIG